MFGREHLNVFPQQLTPQAKRVEKALAEYRKAVNPPRFTTGHVDVCPALKINATKPEKEDIIFQHPYAHVEEMYPIAEQSQVGTAKETLFMLDARQSREFSCIEVLNESWKDTVTAVCGDIGKVLAPGASKINAELYKLLIYRKGDFFNRHQDAQHSARMFATLLFFLPVNYTGGEFKIYKPRSWDDMVVEDKKMPNGCSWVAFYTDVCHRVNEVKEGFRVVLNYCLSFEGAMSPSPALPMGSSAAKVINDYLTSGRKMLAIPLCYEYTQASLSPGFLKGIDAYVFSAIEEVASLELCCVLSFDKTKVIPLDEESDHEQVFQGVFLVKHEIAKKYFEIESRSQQELAKISEEEYSVYHDITKKRDGEYAALLGEIKASQEDVDLEWIVEREESGNPKRDWMGFMSIRFERGEMGWLGNMTPAEEYYYLRAAIIVQGKK